MRRHRRQRGSLLQPASFGQGLWGSDLVGVVLRVPLRSRLSALATAATAQPTAAAAALAAPSTAAAALAAPSPSLATAATA